MAQEATINIRLDDALKRSATAVLEREGVSPTQLVRSLYRYIEREQSIPACLDETDGERQDALERKRALARSVAGSITLPDNFDPRRMREERIIGKYGELL